MKWLSQLHFRTKLSSELKPRFFYELNVRNMERIKIVSWLGIVVFSLLFIIDYLRVRSGVFFDKSIYPALFFNHLIGVILFAGLLLLIRKHRKVIAAGQYNPVFIINASLVVLIITLIGQAVLTYIDRESLVLYTIFILIANWAITLTHNERILFNVSSALLVLTAIFLFGKPSTIRLLIHVYEVLGFTFLAFVFNTFDFNLRWQGFTKGVELAREKKRIESLEQVKTNLYTNLTHEFRTPLTVIRGMTDLAHTYIQKKKWADAYNALDAIETHSDNILNLINQLLNLAQLESSVMTLHLEQKDIIKFSRMAMGQLEAAAMKKNINCTFSSDREEFFMDIDEEKLQSAITNLISNAIKFNHENGEVNLDLTVNSSEEKGRLMITVTDSGYGIGKEHLPYIFDRFYQADTGPTRKTTGTGIGLALTKELIELMGGSITVDSQLGKGTRFSLYLPISHEMEVVEIDNLTQDKIRHADEPKFLPHHGEKPWLLIVEDNADVRDYLAELLEGEYVIELANDGVEGAHKAKELIPDLIISDVMMPGKSGFSLCMELKEFERTNHIPILLLTAKASTRDRMDGWSKGADAYMTKPFKPDELRLRLQKLHELRLTLQEKYRKLAMLNDRQALRTESSFLHDLNSYLDDHLQDRDFSIENLAKALFMSRMQLHRKLKAMTDRSASNYVRTYRLFKAKPMLHDQSLRIADIAYAVGFEDPGYFSRAFQKEFGETPSNFRKRE